MAFMISRRNPKTMIGTSCFPFTSVSMKNLFNHLALSPLLKEFLEDLPSISFERAAYALTGDTYNLFLLYSHRKDQE
jgi:hypothetical protein